MQTTESRQKLWREWRGFILFLVIMFVFRSAIADWNNVPTGSMIPTILEGDRIVVDKTAYDLRVPFTMHRITTFADPQRSDVITFESPTDGILLVKRVIGVPGDEVELRDNRLLINGEEAHYQSVTEQSLPDPVRAGLPPVDVYEEQLLGAVRTIMLHRYRPPEVKANFSPITVPPGQYLVLGDNRDVSRDYRYINFIDRHLILGRANSIAFSLDYENYYVPRSDRFFQDLQ